MGFNIGTHNFDQEETLQYQPGQRVELKARPGVVDVIAEYDPMMVPPIWLANDPKPRYPHELNLLPRPVIDTVWSKLSKPRLTGHPGQKARTPLATPSC